MLFLAQHLDEPDRLLIEQVYQHKMNPAEVARLMGKHTRTVRNRLEQIVRHLGKAEFRFMVLRADLLAPTTRRVAELVILRRMSLRQAARELNCSLHKVRQHIEAVQTLARL
jgi:DNA-directed RNA polymerase specialized sigma24 family protein